MNKKIIIFLTLLLLLNACDYKPIYKNFNQNIINIEILEFNGDSEINSVISTSLKKYIKKKSTNPLKIKVNSVYEKKEISKDSTGKISSYKINLVTNFIIEKNEKLHEFKIKKNFDLKTLENKFEQINYESSLKKSIANTIADEFIIKLLSLDDLKKF